MLTRLEMADEIEQYRSISQFTDKKKSYSKPFAISRISGLKTPGISKSKTITSTQSATHTINSSSGTIVGRKRTDTAGSIISRHGTSDGFGFNSPIVPSKVPPLSVVIDKSANTSNANLSQMSQINNKQLNIPTITLQRSDDVCIMSEVL